MSADGAGPRSGRPVPVGHRAGLCGLCRHSRIVESGKGSRFWLCRRSKEDPRFPKYPPLPVRACGGFEPEVDGGGSAGGGTGSGDGGDSRDEIHDQEV